MTPKEKLYDKIKNEYEQFYQNLLKSPPEEIAYLDERNKDYQYIANAFKSFDIGEDHSITLLKQKSLLGTIYNTYFYDKERPKINELEGYIFDMAVDLKKNEFALRDKITSEFCKQAVKNGFEIAPSDNPDMQIEIFHNGNLLAELSNHNMLGVLLNADDTEKYKLYDILQYVKDYVNTVENAPPLELLDEKGFKLLCEYKDTVLAAKYKSNNEYEFVTWDYTYGKTGLTMGHYMYDYATAKREFSIRSGLMNPNELFTDKEIKQLYEAAVFYGRQNDNISFEDDKALHLLVEKLEPLLPEDNKQDLNIENTEETENEL